jgi:hypothetical protein
MHHSRPLPNVIAISASSSMTWILFLLSMTDITRNLFIYIFSLHTKNITNMGNNEGMVNESVLAKN